MKGEVGFNKWPEGLEVVVPVESEGPWSVALAIHLAEKALIETGIDMDGWDWTYAEEIQR